MKRNFLLSVSILFFVPYLFATVRTVSNNPSTVAQFNTIQAAINASSAGDTIYVHGSPAAYGVFTLDRQLVIIGPGWSPDKQLSLTANVQGCTINGTASSSELQGLSFTGNVNVQTTTINDLKFIRNRFFTLQVFINPANLTVSGFVFEGNWFENTNLNSNASYTLSNFIFQNNIFWNNGSFVSNTIFGFTNSVNILFDHNLWYGPSGGDIDVFGSNCRFLTITNNIFVRRNVANSNSSSTFNNNITFNTGQDAPWTVNSNVDGGGNAAGQSPQMVDEASVDGGTDNPFLDFTIAAGPANNSGSDGKDMGLLFDPTGRLNWSISRGSRLPYIVSMNVTTPTVAPGGNVSVTIESRRNN